MRLADIQAVDPEGRVVLLAEVKSRSNRGVEWAAEYRRNLAAHGAPLGRYLLLVTRDDSYLWSNEDESADDGLRAPDRVASTKALLGPNFGVHVDDQPSSTFLEHLVAAWLATIATSPSPENAAPEIRDFLLDSGLWSALRDANVRVA